MSLSKISQLQEDVASILGVNPQTINVEIPLIEQGIEIVQLNQLLNDWQEMYSVELLPLLASKKWSLERLNLDHISLVLNKKADHDGNTSQLLYPFENMIRRNGY